MASKKVVAVWFARSPPLFRRPECSPKLVNSGEFALRGTSTSGAALTRRRKTRVTLRRVRNRSLSSHGDAWVDRLHRRPAKLQVGPSET